MIELQSGTTLTMELNDYRGPSAYEVAVKNGFEGTEEEWLASLKGEPGADGESVTVNGKRAVDGNIIVNATDIQLRAGTAKTIGQHLDELTETVLLHGDVADNLSTDRADMVLSAAQGVALKTELDAKADTRMYLISFPASGWSESAPYTQQAEADGLTSADYAFADVDLSEATADTAPALLEAWGMVGRIETAAGMLKAYCYEEAPAVDLSVLVKVVS